MGIMILAPQNLKTKFFQTIFYNFFLLVEEHSTKLLAFTLHIAHFLNGSIIFLLMMFSGRLIYEALKVKIAVIFSRVSSYLSSTKSPKPIAVIQGSLPKPSSSGIVIQFIPLYPNLVYFAVRSPMVIVLLSPKQMVTVFYIAWQQVNISCKKDVSAVSSNLNESAPSESSFKFGETTIAFTKLVLSKVTLSFSPQMKRPSIISSKKLFSLSESLTINEIFFDFYISPLIISEEPSMIAFYISLSFNNFCKRLLSFVFDFILIFQTRVSVKRWHLVLVSSTTQLLPLIQLIGVVKSTDNAQCKPSLMKGIEQVISFSQQTYLYQAS